MNLSKLKQYDSVYAILSGLEVYSLYKTIYMSKIPESVYVYL